MRVQVVSSEPFVSEPPWSLSQVLDLNHDGMMDGYVFANQYKYEYSGTSTYSLVIQSLYNEGTTDEPKYKVKGMRWERRQSLLVNGGHFF